jgi:hypothetical protein
MADNNFELCDTDNGDTGDFNWENKLSMDACAQLQRERENLSLLDYRTYNFYNQGSCDVKNKAVEALVAKYPNFRFRDGYGVANSCTIDADNRIRYESELTHGRERQQLTTRQFTAVPDFARGSCAPNTESLLVNGYDTSHIRVCNRTVEADFNRYMPYLGCVQDYVEGKALSLPEWLSIGENSREIVRAQQAKKTCLNN